MEDLGQCSPTKSDSNILPELTQYGVCLPFRVAVIGQTNILRVNDSRKGNRRSSIFIHFTPGVCQDCFGVRRRIGRFLTFNECDFSVFHEMFDR